MDYNKYIEYLESLQRNDRRWMYLQLTNIIKALGSETDFEELKVELRLIYKKVLNTPNPINITDGNTVNKKALLTLDGIIIEIIDLINDYYGNYKTLKKGRA